MMPTLAGYAPTGGANEAARSTSLDRTITLRVRCTNGSAPIRSITCSKYLTLGQPDLVADRRVARAGIPDQRGDDPRVDVIKHMPRIGMRLGVPLSPSLISKTWAGEIWFTTGSQKIQNLPKRPPKGGRSALNGLDLGGFARY